MSIPNPEIKKIRCINANPDLFAVYPDTESEIHAPAKEKIADPVLRNENFFCLLLWHVPRKQAALLNADNKIHSAL